MRRTFTIKWAHSSNCALAPKETITVEQAHSTNTITTTWNLQVGRLDQTVLQKTTGHKGSPQYRLNKSKNRFHHRQAGRNNQRLHHQTHNATITATRAPLAIPQL